MRMFGAWGLALTMSILCVAASPARADDGTTMPARCQGWLGFERIAMICDPARESSESDTGLPLPVGAFRASLDLPGAGSARTPRRATYSMPITLDGSEALLPGERLRATWHDASDRAVIGVIAGTNTGARRVLFRLNRLGTSATVAVLPDGRIVATGDKATLTVAARRRLTVPAWTAATPEQAARRVLDGLSSYANRDRRGLYALCAALAPDIRRLFDLQFDPYRRTSCPTSVSLAIEGWDNVPTVVGTSGRITGIRRTSATTAVMTARLHHRYRRHSYGDNPGDRRITARALLERAPDGTWRATDLGPLLPLFDVDDPHPTAPSDAKLAASLAALRKRVAKGDAAVARLTAAERPLDDVAASCPAPAAAREDPAGDARIQRDEPLRAHAGPSSDVVAATAAETPDGGLCVELVTAGDAPRDGSVDVFVHSADPEAGAILKTTLYGGRASAYGEHYGGGQGGGARTDGLVTDLRAGTQGRRLTLAFPPAALQALPRPWRIDVELETDHPLIAYAHVRDQVSDLLVP